MAVKEKTATAETTAETLEFKIPAGELIRLFHNGLISASKDAGRPVICALRLEYCGAELKVISTDSYRLGIDTAVIEGDVAPGSVLVDRADADAIVKMLKTATKNHRHLVNTLEVAVTVAAATLVVLVPLFGQQYTARPVEGEFPNWKRLMPEANSEKIAPTTAIMLNPRLLADYAKLLSDDAPGAGLKLEFNGPTKPVRVTYGRTYVGLIMPIRMPS